VIAMTEKDELALEILIDKHGLSSVVDALARVCVLKAEHVEENWQDEKLGMYWRRAARTISGAALSPHLDGL
jgi:hypothetical protein